MKIGLSFGKCIRDIIEKKVNAKDVLVIVCHTNFDITDSNSWDQLYLHYTGQHSDNWINIDNDVVLAVVEDLWFSGKLHQPRKFNPSYGAWTTVPKLYWLETVPDTTAAMSVAEKDAWDNYQFISGLSGNSALVTC